MGVYIKGIEMPKDGHWGTVSIPFYIHGDGSVSDSKGHVIGSAVPVPPHGRLIDETNILKVFSKEVWGFHTDFAKGIQSVLTEINAAPTIIPATNKE